MGEEDSDVAAISRSNVSAGESEGFNKVEYLHGVAGHLHTAPFAREPAFVADHEGAALDAADFPAVQVLHLDHPELGTRLLVRVREQLERQLEFRLEVLVRLERIARDAADLAVRLEEFRVEVAKLHRLGGAARGAVLGVEKKEEAVFARRRLARRAGPRRRAGV